MTTCSYLIPSLGPEKSQYLWESIKGKLASLNLYTDDVLSEYIMVLLQGGNSREKIYEELVIFMNSPEIAEHFVLWLFGEIEKLLMVVDNGNVNTGYISTNIEANTITTSNDIQMGSTNNNIINSTHNNVHNNAHNNTHNNTNSNSNNNNSSGPRIQGTRNFSKALESAVSKTNKSTRSFSTSADESDRRSGVKTSPGRRVVRSSSGVERDGGRVQKIKVSVDFDREDRRMRTSKRAAFKRLNVSPEDPEEGGPKSPSTSGTIKVKCPYWPNCRAGEACPNVHPTETCKHFPNCQFGDACTFLHPSIPCKFQEKCQNPLCNYQHRPTIATAIASATAASSSSSSGTSTILCKFYPRCVNATCPYLHPVKAPCRYGVDCSRADCPFEHPGGRKGAHLKSVVFAPCKYGKQCARADCPYQHEIESPLESTATHSNNNNNTNNINDININEQMMQ